MTNSFDLYLINQINKGCDYNFLLDNMGKIKGLGNNNKVPKVCALSRLIRPAGCEEKKYRKRSKTQVVDQMRKCVGCDEILTYSEHSCRKCAEVQEVDWLEMPTLNEMKYKLQTHSQIPCAYKRINHFNEKLAQFQGKEKTVIPACVFDEIHLEIKKNNKLTLEELNPCDVKYLLKKLNLSKFYEHINFITNQLNGYVLPTLTPGEEEKLRMMFNLIQSPFSKHSPPWRKNFLNYAYIFRKFMELLSYDWLLNHFSELKSREKLYEQDKIWKQICYDLEWEYIPSI